MPLYSTCSNAKRLPFGGRFVAEIFVQNFKWRVSQRGADVSYILIQLLLLASHSAQKLAGGRFVAEIFKISNDGCLREGPT